MLATILASITFLWHWGQTLKSDYVRENKIMLGDLLEEDDTSRPTPRVGTAGTPPDGWAGRRLHPWCI